MKRIVDFYESNHFIILIILIVAFVLYIKSIKKNNRFSKTENIIEDENDDFDKLIKTGSEVKLNYILTGEIITLVISQNQSKKYKNKSEIRRLYFKSTLAEALNDKKAGDIIKFKVDELKEEYTYVEILDVNNEIFTKEEIESFKGITVNEELKSEINIYKSINSMEDRIYQYTSTRLTFRRAIIDQMNDDDILIINVINAQNPNNEGTFIITKTQFYETFDNVVRSVSYNRDGNYNYRTTPQEAEIYRKSN
jgi:ASC-1-like (ASCH) protein